MKINTNSEIPKQILTKINETNQNISDIYMRLKKSYNELDETIDDEIRQKLGENLNQYLEYLKEFTNYQEVTATKLKKIIEVLDEYENIKIEI